MVAMIDAGLVITAALWTQVTRDVFPIRGNFEQKLNGYGSQKFRSVVVGSVDVALFYPSDTS